LGGDGPADGRGQVPSSRFPGKDIYMLEPAIRPAPVGARASAGPPAGTALSRDGSQRGADQPRGDYPFPEANVSCRTEGAYLVAAVTGALDAAGAPALREHLVRLVAHCAGRLVVDLAAVSQADVSGLTVLIGASRRARLLGGLLRLATPSAVVAEVLQRSGLDRQFDIYPTVGAAVRGPAAA
jgi:anti-sigma B factor antagonist